ncbi:MAG: DUF411 domain-containing protein [Pseudomonadota bacterium]
MKRKSLFWLPAVVVIAAGWAFLRPQQEAQAQEVIVHKSPSCGCCGKWVEHMRAAGFTVVVEDTDDLARVKSLFNVPDNLQSCHTAEIGGYVVEGHVPADAIQRLLQERPDVKGLAVAGMPLGSPGMDQGGYKQPFNAIAWDEAGTQSAYARY